MMWEVPEITIEGDNVVTIKFASKRFINARRTFMLNANHSEEGIAKHVVQSDYKINDTDAMYFSLFLPGTCMIN